MVEPRPNADLTISSHELAARCCNTIKEDLALPSAISYGRTVHGGERFFVLVAKGGVGPEIKRVLVKAGLMTELSEDEVSDVQPS